MSTPHHCQHLGQKLLGPTARIEMMLDVDDDGSRWQRAEVYTATRDGNAPVEFRTARRFARVPYAPATLHNENGLVVSRNWADLRALEALAEKLTTELKAKGVEM